MMVNREGIGDKLADGTKRAGEKLEGTGHLSMAANGQEIPMHDVRLDPMLGVTYIADPTPGRHTAASLSFEGMGAKYFLPELGKLKAKTPNEMGQQQAITAKFHQTIEANGFCYFGVNHGKYPYLEIINAATGWTVDFEELQKTGHRIQTLRQMFNAREGAIRHEIPQRAIGSPPLKKGPLKGNSYDIDYIAKAYYESMGYESNGVPKKETLADLGLDFTLPDHPKATGTPESLVNEYLQEKTAGETIGKSSAKPLRGG
jgi:aldehyde:ferredoxin oxidoreductase